MSTPFIPPNIADILPALGLTNLHKTMSRPGRLRFGRNGSLEVRTVANDWFSYEAGRGGGIVELVEHVRGCDWRSARDWLCEQGFEQYCFAPSRTNQPRQSAPRPTPIAEPEPDTKPVAMPDHSARLWSEAVDPRGTLAEAYLTRRGLYLPYDPARVIRFHPRCIFGKGASGHRVYRPCLLALYRNILTGQLQCVQRTAINAAALESPEPDPGKYKLGRMYSGSPAGAAIMLADDTDIETGLGICEGLETGLRIRRGGWPWIWVAGSKAAIRTFPVLRGIERFIVFADNDDDGGGFEAANTAALRWADAGIYATIQLPPVGDFDDFLKPKGQAHA